MRILLSVLILLVAASGVEAQAQASKHGPKGPKVTVGDQPTVEESSNAKDLAEAVFSELERQIIERYFGKDEETEDEKAKAGHGKGKSGGLPPGLAKRSTLPPGLARHVQRHGTLPPGLAKRDLPEDLEALLPELAEDRARVIVGDDVLLIERATGLVLDVIEDVLRGSGEAGR